MKISILLEALTANFETDMKRASRNSERELKRFQQSAARIGRAVGAAMATAATGVAALTIATTKSADRAIKFAQTLGLTVAELDKLEYIANRTGVDVNTLGSSMQRLTRNLAEARAGAKPAAEALEQLGLRADDLLAMGQDKAFFAIAERLQQVGDRGDQARIAFALLGREGQNLLGMINSSGDKLQRMGDELERYKLSLNALQSANIEKLADTMTEVEKVTELARRRFVSGLVPAVDILIERLFLTQARAGELGGELDRLADRTVRSMAFVMDAVAGVEVTFQVWGRSLTVLFASVELGLWQVADSIINGPGRALNWFIEQANKIPGINVDFRLGLAVPQLEAQMDRARGVIREGLADIQDRLLTPLPGATMLEEYTRRMAREVIPRLGGAGGPLDELAGKADKAAKEVESAAERTIRALELQAATLGMTESQATLYKLGLDQATEAQLRHADGLLRTIDAHGRLQDQMREAEQVFESTRNPLERFNAEIERLNRLRDTHVDGGPLIDGETYRRAVEAAQDALDAADRRVDVWAVNLEEMGRNAARNIHQSFADFLYRPFEDGLKGMLSSFIQMIHRMIVEAAAAQLLGQMFSGMAGSGNQAVASIGGFFGGSRDSGGRGMPGQAYLIGTGAQPEMFIPDTAGEFIPASKQGASQNVFHVTVQAPEGRISRQSDLQLRQSLLGAMGEAQRRGS